MIRWFINYLMIVCSVKYEGLQKELSRPNTRSKYQHLPEETEENGKTSGVCAAIKSGTS
jgi:hypothetical protein